MKVIIGIGDSWTQGEGGVPLKVFEDWGGRIDKTDSECLHLLETEHENSWVNVLCRDYFTDHIPFNLGMRGYGNRGAVKNLFIEKVPYNQITEGYLIFLLSSRVRFDLLLCENKINSRRKFQTFYPHQGKNDGMSERFYQDIYTSYFGKQETIFNILEAQTFAKAYNLKFYFGSAFENMDDIRYDFYGTGELINWKNYLTPNTNYFKILSTLEGNPNGHAEQYRVMPMPSRYLTNCIHPTIEGYKEIAKDMYNKIKL